MRDFNFTFNSLDDLKTFIRNCDLSMIEDDEPWGGAGLIIVRPKSEHYDEVTRYFDKDCTAALESFGGHGDHYIISRYAGLLSWLISRLRDIYDHAPVDEFFKFVKEYSDTNAVDDARALMLNVVDKFAEYENESRTE